MYRCNCTTCHKLAIFHIRLAAASDDFCLLSPLDPSESLGVYKCNAKNISFYFCKTCGGRCFSFLGEGEVAEADIDDLGLDNSALERLGARSGEKIQFWRPSKEKFVEHSGKGYLSVNAFALDARQEGINLSEWTDNKWVMYYDYLTELRGDGKSYDKPYPGGSY